MAYRKHEIGTLIRAGSNDLAAEKILAAFRECDGRQCAASDLLNVNEVTLIRWVARLKLTDRINEVRAKAKRRGAYVRGRPKKRRGWKKKAGM